MPIKRAAGAVIFHRGPGNKVEYLLLKHSVRYWNFPKGGMEKGEREIDTARREVREETGLTDIRILPGFYAREKYFFRASKNYGEISERNKTIMKLVTFYLAESKTKAVMISHEHEGFEWLDFNGASERLRKNRAYKKSQEILKKADDFIFHRKSVPSSQSHSKGPGPNLQTGSKTS